MAPKKAGKTPLKIAEKQKHAEDADSERSKHSPQFFPSGFISIRTQWSVVQSSNSTNECDCDDLALQKDNA
jgi:hypothetical protein